MIPNWMSRTELLVGEENIHKLINKNVLIVGLGGVGGICTEMIARAGIGRMTIIDGDNVDISNTNRQIAALHSTEKMSKANVIGARILDINPNIKLNIIHKFIEGDTTIEILDSEKFDYVVDCIDTLTPKVWLMKCCVDRGLKIVSALGAGGKYDPSKIEIADISKSYKCKLARYVRKKIHEFGITEGITVVFSAEDIDKEKVVVTETAFPKKSIIGTISYMPAIFGCMVASVVIREFLN